jgi:hypothetical protein
VLDNLRRSFDALYGAQAARFHLATTPHDFRQALEETEGTLTTIRLYSNGRTVALANPSILDYLRGLLCDDVGVTTAIVDSATWFQQLRRIWSLVGLQAATVAEQPASLVDCFLRAAIRLFTEPDWVLDPYTGMTDVPLTARLFSHHSTPLGDRVAFASALLDRCRSESLRREAKERVLGILPLIKPPAHTGGAIIVALKALESARWIGPAEREATLRSLAAGLMEAPGCFEDAKETAMWASTHAHYLPSVGALAAR